jgi:hypothetical protein
MARQIVRFYARSARDVWGFLDEAIPQQDIVRRFGRVYHDHRTSPKSAGWYITIVLETEATATKLGEWIAQRPDTSLEMRSWPDVDLSGGVEYSITLDLEETKVRSRFSFARHEAHEPPRFNLLRWLGIAWG